MRKFFGKFTQPIAWCVCAGLFFCVFTTPFIIMPQKTSFYSSYSHCLLIFFVSCRLKITVQSIYPSNQNKKIFFWRN